MTHKTQPKPVKKLHFVYFQSTTECLLVWFSQKCAFPKMCIEKKKITIIIAYHYLQSHHFIRFGLFACKASLPELTLPFKRVKIENKIVLNTLCIMCVCLLPTWEALYMYKHLLFLRTTKSL